MKKLGSIQALRGIAAFAVMACHIIIWGQRHGFYDLPPQISIKDVADLFHICVDVFFTIAGFVMMISTGTVEPGPRASLSFLKRRIIRIYPMYWCVTLMVVPVFLIKPEWVNSSVAHPTSLWHSLLLLPYEGVHLLSLAWTLEHEIFFYLVFGVFLLFTRRFMLLSLVICLGLSVAAGILWDLGSRSPLLEVVTNPLLIEFLLGAALGDLWLKGQFASQTGKAVLTFLISMAFLTFYGNPKVPQIIFLGFPAAGMVFLVIWLETVKGVQFARPLTFMGDISYSLYLVHLPCIAAVGRLAHLFNANSIIYAIASAGVSLGAAVFLHHVVEQPCLKSLRALLIKRSAGPSVLKKRSSEI